MRQRCALVIIVFTLCMFAQSVQTKLLWMQPTYSINSLQICPACSTMYEWLTAHALIHTNNWLQENPLHLRFALFHTPRAIEAQTFDKRTYYGSYPPGAIFPLYLLINALALFNPDIRHDREMQLNMILAWNHAYHIVLTLVLCFIVYRTLRRSRCDTLNATLMACTPAIVQYTNAHSIFWFNLIYSFDQAVLLPCALYVLLELESGKKSCEAESGKKSCEAESGKKSCEHSEQAHHDGNMTWKTTTAQALIAFYGTLTDWLFVFFVGFVYLLRVVEGDIAWPRSLQACGNFLRKSFLFFLPSCLAITFWLYQVQFFGSPAELGGKLISRMGLDIPSLVLWVEALTSGMFHWPELGYGTTGVILLYSTFYIALRLRPRRTSSSDVAYHTTNCYLLLFVPCLLHLLFFVFHSWDHLLSALKLSLALSVLFALLPNMLMHARHTSTLLQCKGRPIYVTTVIVLVTALSFGYLRNRDATRFFALPDPGFLLTGNFIRTNTTWQDVVFSRDPVAPFKPPQMSSIAGRVVYVITSLDHVYHVVHDIAEDFTIKIFYYPHRNKHEINRLSEFLAAQNLPTSVVEDAKAGALLAFDGKAFVRWYQQQGG